MPPSLLLLRRPPLRHPFLSVGLGASSTILILAQSSLMRRPLLCETRRAAVEPNAAASFWEQVSGGSVLGLLGGVALSAFSKTLAILLGMLVLGVQFAASKGYNIIPTTRIQRYIKGINIRSALQENAAFKLSFGATFTLAALARF